MSETEFCQSCAKKNSCMSIYQQMGNSQGPSVVLKVVGVFLLPLVCFIISIATFENILSPVIASELLRTSINLVLGVSITFVLVLIVRRLIGERGKNK